MFANAFGKIPRQVSLVKILDGTQAGRWREPVEPIRQTYTATLAATGDRKRAKDAIVEAKKRLPAFCMSGTAKSRTAPLEHSNVLQIDVDGLGDSLPAVREKLKADPHVVFGFVSSSGAGLKCGLRIDGTRHGDAFTAAQSYFQQRYGLEIDPAVKDRLRLCFVSWDPEAWTNSAAVPLPMPAAAVEAKPTKATRTGTASHVAQDGGSLDFAKLENVEHLADGSTRTACPACRAAGEDRTGDHLLVEPSGRFGCAKYPGDHEHRREIWRLAGPPNTATMPASGAANLLGKLGDSRPKIQLPGNNRLLSDVAREVGAILAATEEIFKLGGFPVTLNDRRDKLELITAERLRTWIEDHLVCYKVQSMTGSDGVIAFKRTLTQTDANGILASPQFLDKLPPIERLNPVRVPVMRRSGRVELLPAGYDPETESFTVAGVGFPADMPVVEAKRVLGEIFGEFVFADAGRSLAVAVAAALTVFARGLLPRKALRPCYVFVSNAEGAGKTLLVKVATVPVLGYAPVGTAPKNEDEMQKVLLAAVMEARAVLFLDNFKRHIASESLEAFCTASEWEGRVLGHSKSFRGENNCTVFLTGNGATVSPDMRRRSLFCELFLEAERAEDRVFKHNLEVPALLEKRSEILGALWALVLDWDKSGRPKPSRSNSSFTDWANVIGGIVEHAGYGCPLETPQIEAAADQDGADMRLLVAAIAGSSRKAVSFDEVVTLARQGGLFERALPPDGDLDAKARSTVGRLLSRYDRRIVGDFRFVVQGKGHSRAFQVEKLSRPAASQPVRAEVAPPEPEAQPVGVCDEEDL